MPTITLEQARAAMETLVAKHPEQTNGAPRYVAYGPHEDGGAGYDFTKPQCAVGHVIPRLGLSLEGLRDDGGYAANGPATYVLPLAYPGAFTDEAVAYLRIVQHFADNASDDEVGTIIYPTWADALTQAKALIESNGGNVEDALKAVANSYGAPVPA